MFQENPTTKIGIMGILVFAVRFWELYKYKPLPVPLKTLACHRVSPLFSLHLTIWLFIGIIPRCMSPRHKEPGSNIHTHSVMCTNSKLYYCQVWGSSVYFPPPLFPIKLCEMSGQKPPYKINRFSMISLKEKQILLTRK
jgi:hypothetical protein